MGLLVEQQVISLNKSHLSEIEALLAECELPFEDCNEHLDNFYGIIRDDRLVAVGALQVTGLVSLLRSIAVLPDYRGKGLAAAVTRHLIDLARSKRITQLFLLTETAEAYFIRFEFHPVDRDLVADDIKATRQFDSLCPSSARAMCLHL